MTIGLLRRLSRSFVTTPATFASRPRFAIVGAGPAGFYTALRVLKAVPGAQIDLFEALPVPFGLVRFGVAPDHQETKAVQNQFDRMLFSDNVRFFGNVSVGTDISTQTLHKHYHAVVYTVGCNIKSKPLGFTGESTTPNVWSAGDFVSWYSAHPHYTNHLDFQLEQAKSVCVVGMGNVALDVARVLLKDADQLKKTDVPDHVLQKLAKSAVKEVHIIGRRGPVESAFTNAELREITNADNIWSTHIPQGSHADFTNPPKDAPRMVQRKLQLFKNVIQQQQQPRDKQLTFHFLRSPESTQPGPNNLPDGLTVCHNELVTRDGKTYAEPTSTLSKIPADLIIVSTGSTPHQIPDLPIEHGVVPNVNGRVVWPEDHENAQFSNVYVAGWAKRGPSGIVGTNLVDAEQTVQTILEDMKEGTNIKLGWEGVCETVDARQLRIVDSNGWQRIKEFEEEEGRKRGKVREKCVTVDQMLEIAGV